MTDVFEEWKKNRFIIAPRELVDSGTILVVLADYKYWVEHLAELNKWCRLHNAEVQGMTIVFNSDADLSAFILRWS